MKDVCTEVARRVGIIYREKSVVDLPYIGRMIMKSLE